MALEGRAETIIDAAINEVFAAASDVASSPTWQHDIKSVEILERNGQGEQILVRTVTDGKVRDLKADLRFSYDAPHSVRWTQERGDLKSIVGSWSFEEVGAQRTRAVYAMTVDFGRVLGAVIRGPVVGVLRSQLISSMPAKLKARVEGG